MQIKVLQIKGCFYLKKEPFKESLDFIPERF